MAGRALFLKLETRSGIMALPGSGPFLSTPDVMVSSSVAVPN